MSDDPEILRERLNQSRAARGRELLDDRGAVDVSAGHVSGTFPLQARVFDRVSGQEGIVVGYSRENVIVPTAR